MKASRIDSFGIGILVALLGGVISFYGFGMYWAYVNNTDLDFYINEVFLGMDFFQDRILSLSVLFDIILFALFYKLKHYRLCRGIVLVVLLAVPLIIYLY